MSLEIGIIESLAQIGREIVAVIAIFRKNAF